MMALARVPVSAVAVPRNHPDYAYWEQLGDLPDDEKWESLIGIADLIAKYPKFTTESIRRVREIFGAETEDDGHGYPVRCLLGALVGEEP